MVAKKRFIYTPKIAKVETAYGVAYMFCVIHEQMDDPTNRHIEYPLGDRQYSMETLQNIQKYLTIAMSNGPVDIDTIPWGK